jgi:hypothetical protein
MLKFREQITFAIINAPLPSQLTEITNQPPV